MNLWQLGLYDRDHCWITLNSGGFFLWPARYTRDDSQVFRLLHKCASPKVATALRWQRDGGCHLRVRRRDGNQPSALRRQQKFGNFHLYLHALEKVNGLIDEFSLDLYISQMRTQPNWQIANSMGEVER